MLALVFLTAVAGDSTPDRHADPHHPARSCDPVALTVPEVRQPLAAVFIPPLTSAARLLHSPIWRRRHQTTAHLSNYRRWSTR
ncbi:hypothetical protein [Streptomyces sp. NPDC018584]|uniref:hypothetical protein n=1 Tax=unclassified Streptomyces TaxID=2593676 RepID=UPI003789316E